MPLQYNTETLSLLAQIPLLGIFIVALGLVLWFFRDWMNADRKMRQAESEAERQLKQKLAETDVLYRQRQAETDALHREKEANRQRDWQSIQNELFLQAIKDDRSAYSELRDEIKALTKAVMDLSHLIISHDAKSTARNK